MARRKYNYIINDKTSGLARKRITPTKVEDIPDISVDKGMYSSGTAYERGDRVVHNGIVWQALRNTNTEPDFDDNTWRYVSPLDPTSAELKHTVSGDVINGSGTAHLYVHVIISGFDVSKQMAGGLSIAEQSGAIEVTRPYSDQPWFFAIKPKGEIKSAEVCTVRIKHDSLDRSVTAVVLLIPNGATLTVEQLQQLRETAQGVGGDRIVAYLDKEIPVRAREEALTAANKELESLLAELEALKEESQGTSADVAAKIGEILKTIAEQQEQIDGEVSNWFYPGAPAVDKQPESDWTTNAHKARHIGDTYTSTDKEGPHMGKSWRYTTKFEWQEIADTLVSQALSKAKEAQSTADGKSTTYLSKPIRYEKGDTWILESDMSVGGKSYKAGTLLFATADSEVYVGSHWQDKTRYIGAIEVAESERKSKEAWEKYANAQATNAGSAALKTAKEYAEAQDKLLKTQTDAYADGVLTKAEQNALTVAKTQADLAEEQAKAYADGRVTEAEQAAIDKAKQAYTDAVAKAKELDGEIQVGGRNLLKLGMTPPTASGVNVETSEAYTYKTQARNAAWPRLIIKVEDHLKVSKGEDYILTLDVKGKTINRSGSGVDLTIANINGINRISGKRFYPIDEANYTRLVHPFKAQQDSTADSLIQVFLSSVYPQTDSSSLIYVRNIKLERGNKATDWTPAPEDLQADIDKEAKAREAAVKEVKAELFNANSTITTLKDLTKKLEDGMLTEKDIPDIEWLLHAYNEGKTTREGGLLLTKIIALSNQVDRITAYLSGYDGNNGDGKILRAGIKYSEPTSEPTEVVDKEYKVPWVQCLRVGWMRFAGARKAEYKVKYPNGPDFNAIEKATAEQYEEWGNERFEVDDPSIAGFLNMLLHSTTMDYYKDKPRYQGYLNAPKVSDWYVYYADVHTETTPQPIRDTGDENTHIKHDGSAKFGAWSIVREGIYNTPTGDQYAVRLDSDAGELSIRNRDFGNTNNQATVVSRKGIFSNRAEENFLPGSVGLNNGAAIIGFAQLQDNKNALRRNYITERDLKSEEGSRADDSVPLFSGMVGMTGHYGESRYYRNFGGYFEHLYASGLHIATRTVWGANNTVVLTPTDGRVLLIEPDNPYVKLPKADSVYPGWTVDVAWANKKGYSFRIDSTDGTRIIRHTSKDTYVSVTEATGTIRITRIRRNKRIGSNDIAWFIEYLGWLR